MARVSTAQFPQPLRGRDRELTALRRHLDRVRAGYGPVLVVEGGAGMGKSRLLAELTTMARSLSIDVGCGVGAPESTVVQMSALMEALFDGRAPVLERSALPVADTTGEQRYWLPSSAGA